jgi:glycosyltransferase involved in cell wall biosynthesis
MTPASPAISVVVPTRDRADLLRQTLASLVAQVAVGADGSASVPYRDFEAIVVDDHSGDDSAAVVEALAAGDGRFRLLRATGRGAPAARNQGARAARGRYVVFLDSDDLLAPTALAGRVAFMDARGDLDFAVWPAALFQDTPGDASLRWNIDTGTDDLDRLLAGDVPWQTTGPTWRRESLAKVGDWDEQCLAGQDWEFHIRALCADLRYARADGIDFHWRMPGERASLSAQSRTADRVRARPSLLERVLAAVTRAGKLTPRRRMLFAGLFFTAARQTAEKLSRRDSRVVWHRALELGLVDRATWSLGSHYLLAWRVPALQKRLERRIERRWPPELLGRRSPTFLKAPLDPSRPPTVSVLMCVHNAQRYLEQAVTSILRQTFRDFELVVIDDGSTDGTRGILERLASADARMRVISRPNTGLARALNEGLAHCRGEFVARMDGDDVALPERFARQVAFLRGHPDVVVVGTRVLYVNPFDLPVSGDEATSTSDHPLDHDAIDAQLLAGRGGSIVHPAAMFRREAMLGIGGYREHYNNSEDLDLFLRLAETGRVANLPDVLLRYRRHLESVSHQKYENQWRLKRQIVEEAYRRRGLAFPADWTFTPWQPKPPARQLREWGWFALRAGQSRAARSLAWDALRREPLAMPSWKLMLCAIRGH